MEVDLSLDGVHESKSSNVSLDVYTSRFHQCRTIYVHQIVRPLPRFKIDNQKYLRNFLNQIRDTQCLIKCIIGDSPKRSFIKGVKGHSSYHPCEYCFQKGVLFHVSDANLTETKQKLLAQKTLIQNQIQQLTNDEEYSEEVNTLKDIEKNIDDAVKNIAKKKSYIVWPYSTKDGEPRTRDKIIEITEKIENSEVPIRIN